MLLRSLTAMLVAALLGGCVVVLSPSLFNNKPGLAQSTLSGEGSAKVLVLDINGFISEAPTQRAFGLVQERSTLDRVRMQLKKAARDPEVKALVLRIDSPGGGVTASDEIYHLIKQYHREQQVPVVASLGGIAASGGYYIACSAQRIVAQPTTVTGSIGVIILGVNVAGLMNKLGVENQTFTTGPHKDLLSPLRQATPAERKIVHGVLDALFTRFKSVVLDNRPNLDKSHLKIITDGRIFAADDARKYGLVDSIGRIDDAIDLAKQRAGIKHARVIRYHRHGYPTETVYSSDTAPPAQASFNSPLHSLTASLPASLLAGSQFLYLWRPGLEE